ncbi:uncharacterized protein [Solanum lycopersicum]|uniref:uncharacterized protein n=1 Tax=Solanum lycopersicum TaxID=4081 RepID=UPI0037482CAD
MAQLSAIVNTRQLGSLPSNTFQNPKNNLHCMAITTRGEESNGNDAEVPLKGIPMPRPPPPFPQRLVKKTEDGKYRHFITMLKQISINVPLVEALEQMPGYAKFMKDLVTKKRLVTFEDDDRLQHCSDIASRSLVQKKEDSDPKPSAMRLLMTDRTVKSPIGILHDVLVKVESFIFPADFGILDCEVDFEVPNILGRQFLRTGKALVDMEKGQMTFRLNNEEATFNICRTMR